jgi:hypothetical protein
VRARGERADELLRAAGSTTGPQLIGEVRGSQAIAVTQEPCAGSRRPTMDPNA